LPGVAAWIFFFFFRWWPARRPLYRWCFSLLVFAYVPLIDFLFGFGIGFFFPPPSPGFRRFSMAFDFL